MVKYIGFRTFDKIKGLFWKDMDGMSFYSGIEFKYYRPVYKFSDKYVIRFYWIPIIPLILIFRTTKRILKFIIKDILKCRYLVKEYNKNKCQNKNKNKTI